VSEKTDLFALGAVLYFCLTMRSPFQGGSLTATLRNIGVSEPPALAGIRPDLDPFWANCIAVMLQKRPEDRQVTALSLADAMREYLRERSMPEPKQITKAALNLVDFTDGRTLNEESTAALQAKLASRYGQGTGQGSGSSDEDREGREGSYGRGAQVSRYGGSASPSAPAGISRFNKYWAYILPVIIMSFTYLMSHQTLPERVFRRVMHKISPKSDALEDKSLDAGKAVIPPGVDSLIQSIRKGWKAEDNNVVLTAMSNHLSNAPQATVKLAMSVREAARKSEEAKRFMVQSEYFMIAAYFANHDFAKAEPVANDYVARFPQSPYHEAVISMVKSLKQMKDYGLY
jgi:serine/threonine protein kinase